MDDDTRKFKRRLSDTPAHVWTRRVFWIAVGAAGMWAYTVLGTALASVLRHAPERH